MKKGIITILLMVSLLGRFITPLPAANLYALLSLSISLFIYRNPLFARKDHNYRFLQSKRRNILPERPNMH